MVPTDVLWRLDVFKGLTDKEVKAVSGISETLDFKKDSVVFRDNDDARDLYILLEGRVSMLFEVGRGREAIVHTAGEGEAFGWSALVQPYRFTSTAKALEDSRVVSVDGPELKKLMEKDCYLGFVIMEKLAELISSRLRDTRLQMINLVHG
jgi:CRP-like cAMP-binding protein